MTNPPPDLREARRLLHCGMHLVPLHRNQKRPMGDDWNSPHKRVKVIDDNATGYGLPLASNKLCSVDPDNWPLAVKGMRALGFALEAIMAAGVRTRSTRPASGGRSAFAEEPDLSWLKFKSKATGTVIEFRADSSNLQDCVPGVVYADSTGELRTQQYANDKTLDDAPGLPDDLMAWWQRCSTDISFLNEQEEKFFAALNVKPSPSISTGRNGSMLAYAAPGYRGPYNAAHSVESILERHDYTWDEKSKRWAPPTATGSPAVRPIPGKDGLWQSDHASDPLSGTFDAWIAYVVLNHNGILEAAIAEEMQRQRKTDNPQDVDPDTGKPMHPLARFVNLDMQPKAVRTVVPGFIGHGVTTIAGAQGAGKTTTMLPLAMVVAGLHAADDQLAPLHWRHVVYIVEDVEQAQRIVAGIVNFSNLGLDAGLMRERLHIVEARRLHPTYVAEAGALYCERFTRTVEGVEILPLVVIDTKSAVLEIESENDNSEASAAMAALKQGFAALPVWLIGHVAKTDIGRTDIATLTARGAGAYEADANQVLYLIKEKDGTRYLVRGKTRFEANWSELKIEAHRAETIAPNEFGGMEPVTMLWGIAAPPELSRSAAVVQAREAEATQDAAELRQEIRDAVETAWKLCNPLNRQGVMAQIKRQRALVSSTLENLLSERWLYEVGVPAKERTHSRRAAFLVNFTTVEHEALLKDGTLPAEKLKVPTSWKKPVSYVPDRQPPEPEIGVGGA